MTIVNKELIREMDVETKDVSVRLGDDCEDKVSGFRGIAISHHTFLYGPPNVTLQPLVDVYGLLPEFETFNSDRLKVIKPKRPSIKIL